MLQSKLHIFEVLMNNTYVSRKTTKKKFEIRNLLSASNILIIILIIFYILDCYLPLPKGYTGYNAWDSESSPVMNYIFGSCGGLLTNYLGVGSALVNGNAVYRHITLMFLHGGILHLIVNIVGLYFIGNYAEKRFGWWLTLILFFLTGFLESYITDPLFAALFPKKAQEYIGVSVGASGGIFGLMGASLAAIFFDIKSFEHINQKTLIVSAIYGILVTYIVDLGYNTVCHNVALLLGLAVGTMLILPFYILKKKSLHRKTKKITRFR